jgi:four helix bundle protein
MSEIRSFRDLDAWRVSMDVVELTYRVTADFPDGERFGLVSQMRRSATSVPSNIAEGQAVRATKWGLRHIITAIGSSCELDTQLEVAVRLKFIQPAASQDLRSGIDRMQKLLYGLRRERERRLGLAASGAVLFLAMLLCFFA